MKLPLLLWAGVLFFVSLAAAQVGTPNFSSVQATTGTVGTIRVGTAGGGAILTGTSGVLYVGGVAVGSGTGGGVSTGTASLLIAGGTIGSGVTLGSVTGGSASGLTLQSGTASTAFAIGTGTNASVMTAGTAGGLFATQTSGTHRVALLSTAASDNPAGLSLTGAVSSGGGGNLGGFNAFGTNGTARTTMDQNSVVSTLGAGTQTLQFVPPADSSTYTLTLPSLTGTLLTTTGTTGSGFTLASGTASFTAPASNGSNGQVLTFDGAGGTSWTTVSGGTGSTSLAMGTVGSITGGTAGGVITGTNGTLTAAGLTLASGSTSLIGTIRGGTGGSIVLGNSTSAYRNTTTGGLVVANAPGTATNSVSIGAGNIAMTGELYFDSTTDQYFSPGQLYYNSTFAITANPSNFVSTSNSAIAFQVQNLSAIIGSPAYFTVSVGTVGGMGAFMTATGSATNVNATIMAKGTGGVVSTGTSSFVTRNVEMAYTELAYGTAMQIELPPVGTGFQGVTATGTYMSISLTGYPTTGTQARSVTLFITAGTAALTIVPEAGWRFMGTGTPSTIAANKIGTLALTAVGTSASKVRANYSEEP